MTPELFDVVKLYIDNGFSIEKTAEAAHLTFDEVNREIKKPEAQSYINEVYLDTGYRNRAKIGALMDKIIDTKIEEAEESGIYTNKDLLEVLTLLHKMRMDEAKMNVPDTQVNIANFQGNAYTEFMKKLTDGTTI